MADDTRDSDFGPNYGPSYVNRSYSAMAWLWIVVAVIAVILLIWWWSASYQRSAGVPPTGRGPTQPKGSTTPAPGRNRLVEPPAQPTGP